MKYKTTRKAIVNGCANIKCAGFCDLQHLLKKPRADSVHLRGLRMEL